MADDLNVKELSTASLMGRRSVLKVQVYSDRSKVMNLIAVDTELLRRLSEADTDDAQTVKTYLDR